ncbi:MAG: tetratricopeptide repeat protein [Chitinivibrionales bacterium]|nr:tetratricopeptide repeat protein [Chitinivibrionales bacterium]MBD3356297.1 tetratricopeptide repeat protein [Chitinivibrionales bacterium]
MPTFSTSGSKVLEISLFKLTALRAGAFPAIWLFVLTSNAADLHEMRLSYDRWGALNATQSPINNPVFLTRANFLSFRTVFSSLVDELYVHDIGATLPLGLRHTAGFSWMTLAADSSLASFGSATDEERYEYEAGLFMFSYGMRPWGSLSFGFNLNIVREKLLGEKEHIGFGLDPGVGLELPTHPLLGRHSLAVTAQNAVAPTLSTGEPFPRVARLSLLSIFWDEAIESDIELAVENPFQIIGEPRSRERERWKLSGRLGYRSPKNINVHILAGIGESGFSHVGIAGGLRLPTYIYDKPRNLTLEYQHSRISKKNVGGPSIHLGVEVGNHRLTAEVLMQKAFDAYNDGLYWDALLIFGRVTAEYPNFVNNDAAAYYMAECQLNLGMYKAASFRFSRIPKHFSHSNHSAGAVLGLMTIHYREGRHDSVSTVYRRFNKMVASDSLKNHAHYLMSQAHIKRGKYSAAAKLLKKIARNHPDYLFAQHSLVIADMNTGRSDAARRRLLECIRREPHSNTERALINRCRVMLGYWYYEHRDKVHNWQTKATDALSNVPRYGGYFEDALLGLAWIRLKTGRWEECLAAAVKLAESKQPVVAAEGLLLMGYGQFVHRRYDQAIAILKKAESLITKERIPTHPNETRCGFCDELDSLGIAVDHLARKRRRPSVRRDLAEAGERYGLLKRKISACRSQAYKTDRNFVSARRIPTLRNDIHYVLASAAYRLQQGNERAKPKLNRQQKRIDKKIEGLENKIKNLESLLRYAP